MYAAGQDHRVGNDNRRVRGAMIERRGHVNLGERHDIVGRPRADPAAADIERALVRKGEAHRHVLDAGHRMDAVDRRVEEPVDPIGGRVAGVLQRQRGAHHVGGVEAGTQAHQPVERPQKKSCAHEQHYAHRDLRQNHDATWPAMRRAGDGCHAHRRAQIDAARLERREQAERDAREQHEALGDQRDQQGPGLPR